MSCKAICIVRCLVEVGSKAHSEPAVKLALHAHGSQTSVCTAHLHQVSEVHVGDHTATLKVTTGPCGGQLGPDWVRRLISLVMIGDCLV